MDSGGLDIFLLLPLCRSPRTAKGLPTVLQQLSCAVVACQLLNLGQEPLNSLPDLFPLAPQHLHLMLQCLDALLAVARIMFEPFNGLLEVALIRNRALENFAGL